MVERFFFGLDGSARDIKIDWPHVLISAATLWNGKRFRKARIHPAVQEIFLDSGGFSFFQNWSKYPFSTDEYLVFVRDFCEQHPQTRYVSIMDYPCEPYVNREVLHSNYERIDETLRNAQALIHREIPAQWVSVIQGHEYDEYLYCVGKMREKGLWTKLTAVGSIFTRKSLFEINHILRLVTKYHSQVRYHAFGLEYRALLNRDIWNMLYSVDSAAWKFGPGTRKKGSWLPGTTAEKMQNFARYKQMITDLTELRNGNRNIGDFGKDLPEIGSCCGGERR